MFFGFCLITITIIMLGLGCAFDLGLTQLISTGHASSKDIVTTPISIWPLITIIAICGGSGGFVQALECDYYHKIPIPFNDKKIDSGIFGHVFIGVFGAIVAISLMIGIFGLDLKPVLNINENLAESLKIFFYIAAISIIGGYSGLPIISLVSNAALKKVQHEVDALKKDGQKTEEEIAELKSIVNQKDEEIAKTKLQGILITAHRSARSEYYHDAINDIQIKYLPFIKDNHRAYHLLAFCQKHVGDIKKAKENINKAINLKPSRLGYFNYACYLTLLGEEESSIYQAIDNAWKYTESDTEKERFISGLQNDEDFTKINKKQKFVDKLSIYEKNLKESRKEND